MAVSPIRWTFYNAVQFQAGSYGTVLVHPFSGPIEQEFMALTVRGFTNPIKNGIYVNRTSADLAIHLGPGQNTQDLDTHVTAGDLEKVASFPPDPIGDQAKKWQANFRYMTGDMVYVDSAGAALWVSAIDNNIQSVFQDRWETGSIAPPNMISGMFTTMIGKQMYLERDPSITYPPRPSGKPTVFARKVVGATYWATDTQTMWVYDGTKWVTDRNCTIPDYDVALDEVVNPGVNPHYQLGDLVHGHLTGRYADSDYLLDTWGIFRRDDVQIWNKINPIHLPADGAAHLFGPGQYLYINQLSGAQAQYNGIYAVQAKIAITLENSATGIQDVLDHLVGTGVGLVKLTETICSPWTANTAYAKGKMIYNGSLPLADKYKAFWICNYNNYTSSATFNEHELFRGWTCLADLNETDGYPNRLAAYVFFGNKAAGEFPNPGKKNTLYIATETGRYYYWDGTQYVHFSEEYPWIEELWAELQAVTITPNVGNQSSRQAVVIKWKERLDENTRSDNQLLMDSSDRRFTITGTIGGTTPNDQYTVVYGLDLQYNKDLEVVKEADTPIAGNDSFKWMWNSQKDQNTLLARVARFLSSDPRLNYQASRVDTGENFNAELVMKLIMTYIKSYMATLSIEPTDKLKLHLEWVVRDDTQTPNEITMAGNMLFQSGDARFLIAPAIQNNGADGSLTFKFAFTYINEVRQVVTNIEESSATAGHSLTHRSRLSAKYHGPTKADGSYDVTDTTYTDILKIKTTDTRLVFSITETTDNTDLLNVIKSAEVAMNLNFPYLESGSLVFNPTATGCEVVETLVDQDHVAHVYTIDFKSTPSTAIVVTNPTGAGQPNARVEFVTPTVTVTAPTSVMQDANGVDVGTLQVDSLVFAIEGESKPSIYDMSIELALVSEIDAANPFVIDPFTPTLVPDPAAIPATPMTAAAQAVWDAMAQPFVVPITFVETLTDGTKNGVASGVLQIGQNKLEIIPNQAVKGSFRFEVIHGLPRTFDSMLDWLRVVSKDKLTPNPGYELVQEMSLERLVGILDPSIVIKLVLQHKFDEQTANILAGEYIRNAYTTGLRRWYLCQNPFPFSLVDWWRTKDPQFIDIQDLDGSQWAQINFPNPTDGDFLHVMGFEWHYDSTQGTRWNMVPTGTYPTLIPNPNYLGQYADVASLPADGTTASNGTVVGHGVFAQVLDTMEWYRMVNTTWQNIGLTINLPLEITNPTYLGSFQSSVPDLINQLYPGQVYPTGYYFVARREMSGILAYTKWMFDGQDWVDIGTMHLTIDDYLSELNTLNAPGQHLLVSNLDNAYFQYKELDAVPFDPAGPTNHRLLFNIKGADYIKLDMADIPPPSGATPVPDIAKEITLAIDVSYNPVFP